MRTFLLCFLINFHIEGLVLGLLKSELIELALGSSVAIMES